MRQRTDGITLRAAVDADLEQVLELNLARGDEQDAVEARVAFLDGPDGPRRFLIAVEGKRVVAALSLWSERVRVGGTWLPAGQLDFVATDRAYEGRGLTRDLIGLAHEESGRRGDLLQILVGIPYFYRQFAYTYVVPMPDIHTVAPERRIETPGDLAVRVAGEDDLLHLRRLQDSTQSAADVAMPHSDDTWRWMLASETVELRIVESARDLVASARTSPDDGRERISLSEVATEDKDAVLALVDDARRGRSDRTIEVEDRCDGTVAAALSGLAERRGPGDEYMLRVDNAARLLDSLRPELSRRLATSSFAEDSGELLISFYRAAALLGYERGAVTNVTAIPGVQGPVDAGGSGVPPDLVADLVFGPHGAEALDDMYPDLNLGKERALMATLFPAQRADILTYYLG